MIRPPGSLRARLVTGAAILLILALAITGAVTAVVLRHFMQAQIDSRLDTQLRTIAAALEADAQGRLALSRNVDGPPFERPGAGWYWQVLDGPTVRLRSASLGGASLDPPPPPRGSDKPPPGVPPPPHAYAAELAGPDGETLRVRSAQLKVGSSEATIMVGAPRRALDDPLNDVLRLLTLCFGTIGAGLLAAVVVQVRVGLLPLRRLQSDLADIREGRGASIPADQPAEISPLVAELNSLLEQNAANLDRARRHVANLAHGLKTPLATLAVGLARSGHDSDRSFEHLIGLMDRRIRHHLARARAAALGGPVRSQTGLAPRVSDLVQALLKVYADKGLSCEADVPADLMAACDGQDCDEMLGNILDNAFKWAKTRVDVTAQARGKAVMILVEDDGPGLPEGAAVDVLRPGRRLDEAAPGYGFGLAITRELVELYGGELRLGASPLGGLKVEITLPRVERSR